jgi:hypothetical protein
MVCYKADATDARYRLIIPYSVIMHVAEARLMILWTVERLAAVTGSVKFRRILLGVELV